MLTAIRLVMKNGVTEDCGKVFISLRDILHVKCIQWWAELRVEVDCRGYK